MSAVREDYEPLRRLSKDLKEAAKTLTKDEARFLVDFYYQMQKDRIRTGNQTRALSESGEPHQVIVWLGENTMTLESQIKRALEAYASADPAGAWSMSITGIGPVISAGLLAHIEIEKAPTAGHIWRFAGLDASVTWQGQEKAAALVASVMDRAAPTDAELDNLKEQLEEADIPFDDVTTLPDGRLGVQFYDDDEVTDEQREKANEILAAFQPTPSDTDVSGGKKGRGRGAKRNPRVQEVTTEHIIELARLSNRKVENLIAQAADEETNAITRRSLTAALARRPWNARLKVVAWKCGQSFVKVSTNPNDFYGRLWRERKEIEQRRNDAGDFADQAATILANKRIGKETDAYKFYSTGKLPPAHIQARAERWVVKLFLSHYHAVAYRYRYGKDSPHPYVITHMGHVDYIPVPNWPFNSPQPFAG